MQPLLMSNEWQAQSSHNLNWEHHILGTIRKKFFAPSEGILRSLGRQKNAQRRRKSAPSFLRRGVVGAVCIFFP